MSSSFFQVLMQNPLLDSLTPQATDRLCTSIRRKIYAPNQPIHRKGEFPDGLYGVVSGVVKISATAFDGNEVVLTRIKSGGWFGEIALLDGGTRTHDAFAAGDAVLAFIPSHDIQKMRQAFPTFEAFLVAQVCRHCRAAFAAVDELLALSTEQRLAWRLIDLLEKNMRIPITQQEIADMTGLSRQSVNKILKNWQKEGLVRIGYREITVLDQEGVHSLYRQST